MRWGPHTHIYDVLKPPCPHLQLIYTEIHARSVTLSALCGPLALPTADVICDAPLAAESRESKRKAHFETPSILVSWRVSIAQQFINSYLPYESRAGKPCDSVARPVQYVVPDELGFGLGLLKISHMTL